MLDASDWTFEAQWQSMCVRWSTNCCLQGAPADKSDFRCSLVFWPRSWICLAFLGARCEEPLLLEIRVVDEFRVLWSNLVLGIDSTSLQEHEVLSSSNLKWLCRQFWIQMKNGKVWFDFLLIPFDRELFSEVRGTQSIPWQFWAYRNTYVSHYVNISWNLT